MKKSIIVLSFLSLFLLMISCGGKKAEKTQNTPAPAPSETTPSSVPQGKPAEIKKEVEDIQQMREQENEKRLQEITQ
mgnify:CR=1 FL=1